MSQNFEIFNTTAGFSVPVPTAERVTTPGADYLQGVIDTASGYHEGFRPDELPVALQAPEMTPLERLEKSLAASRAVINDARGRGLLGY